MVAPLAERLGIPYPATDKSCVGRGFNNERWGVGFTPDKETCWRRRWVDKEQGNRSLAAGSCRSQRRGSHFLIVCMVGPWLIQRKFFWVT